QRYCSEQRIQWKFIASLPPWQGGVYERLIGITKNALRRAIGRRAVTDEMLHTFLAECEAIINERPLTFISDDSMDTLRPVDFLIPKASIQLEGAQTMINETDEDYRPRRTNPQEQLVKKWQGTLKSLDCFWKFWQEAYLDTLREMSQVKHRNPRSTTRRTPRED
ncbi:hypothetical protein Tcan_01238, partial [Toxocara canis]